MDITEILADYSNSLEETRNMMYVLGHDCNDLYLTIKENDSQLYRRAYVRSVFAFIEGILYRTKITTAHLGMLLGNISVHELIVLEDTMD